MFNAVITVVLFILSFTILFFNEDKTIRQQLSLREATAEIVELKWHNNLVAPEAIGRLVHLTGTLVTGEPLTEPDYNIQVQAVKLRRRVAMYQWVEESVERIGNPHPQDVMDHDERQYFYAMEWREKLIDSSNFYLRSGHQNPPNFPFQGRTQISEKVTIGPYELGEDIKAWFNNYILITSDTRPDIPGVKMHSGFYYHADDVHEPKLGDIRVQFFLAGLEGTAYTVVGLLNEAGVIGPFRSKFGQSLLIIKAGELSVEDVLSQERFSLSVKSWAMRVLGTGLLYMALSKMVNLVAEQRFKGNRNLSRVLRSFRLGSVRFMFALSTSILLLALVWAVHEPLVGVSLLMGAALLYYLSLKILEQ